MMRGVIGIRADITSGLSRQALSGRCLHGYSLYEKSAPPQKSMLFLGAAGMPNIMLRGVPSTQNNQQAGSHIGSRAHYSGRTHS